MRPRPRPKTFFEAEAEARYSININHYRNKLSQVIYNLSMFGRRAFSVAGPMEWNSLPDSLRDPARSTDSFISALKTHLFTALRDD